MLKKIMALSAAALLGLAGLTGCTAGEVGANSSVPGTDTGKSGSGDTSTAAKLTGSLVMAGSTSMEKVCGALGEAFGDQASRADHRFAGDRLGRGDYRPERRYGPDRQPLPCGQGQ